MKVPFMETDGGRSQYFKGDAGDCVTRAIAIAFQMDYREAYDLVTAQQKQFVANTRSNKYGKAGTARSGVFKPATRQIMEHLGATWTPTMGIGTGCTVHVHPDELPAEGRYILSLSRHVAAWVDGVLHDAYDSSRDGTRCVYGYWKVPATQSPYPTNLKFTPSEWEIIEHRLEVPEALGDALEQECERDAVADACDRLIASGGHIDWQLTRTEWEVLLDACNGSVFMACADPQFSELSWGKWMAYCRACNSIEGKLPVEVPRG